MNNLFKITLFTLADQARQKSFFFLLGISILAVLMIRSCYNGNYQVNGETMNNLTIAWHASLIAFQVVCGGMMLMATMMAMKVFTRDFDDGSATMFLSRPVIRWHYIAGRILGIWLLSLIFMFILHLTIFFITWAKTGGFIPGYLTASLLSSINLLFVILCVSLLSLFLPDVISALSAIIIVFIGLVSDGGFQIMNSAMVQSVIPAQAASTPAIWRVFYPKIFMLQSYAGTLISKGEFHSMGPVHPVINVLMYVGVLATVLVVVFNKKEI